MKPKQLSSSSASSTTSAGMDGVVPGVIIAKKSRRRLDQDELANRVTCFGLLTIYNAALLGCMLLNIMTKGSIGAFETMGIHFAQSYFNLDPAIAGTIVSINGVIGVCTLLSMGYIGRVLSDIQMILGGIGIFAAGILSFIWLRSVEMGAENSIVHYVIGITMIYGIGYPIGHTALIGLFSKGKRKRKFAVDDVRMFVMTCTYIYIYCSVWLRELSDTTLFSILVLCIMYKNSGGQNSSGSIARMVCRRWIII